MLLLVFYLSLYVNGFFKLLCPRITRKNENIFFLLEVKGETLPPTAKNISRTRKQTERTQWICFLLQSSVHRVQCPMAGWSRMGKKHRQLPPTTEWAPSSGTTGFAQASRLQAAGDQWGASCALCALPLAFLHMNFSLKSCEDSWGKVQHMLVKRVHREARMTFLKLCHFSLIVTFETKWIPQTGVGLVRMTCSPCVGMAASDPKPAKN